MTGSSCQTQRTAALKPGYFVELWEPLCGSAGESGGESLDKAHNNSSKTFQSLDSLKFKDFGRFDRVELTRKSQVLKNPNLTCFQHATKRPSVCRGDHFV